MQAPTRIFGTIEAIIVAATVYSCAVGPDFHSPAPKVNGYTSSPLPAYTASADVIGGSAQTLQAGGEIPGQWWSLFHSAQLDRLVDEALKANPNVTAAQAALREANESAAAEKGFLYPSVTAGVTGLRERRLFYHTGLPMGITSPYNLLNAGVNVSYTLDVFRGIRRQVEAANAQSSTSNFSGSDLSHPHCGCRHCRDSGGFATWSDLGNK